MPISVVVPVSKDEKIKQCLESVDERVEIIVVLNNHPSARVVELIRLDGRCRVIRAEEEGCNLARVFNLGIASAGNRKVLLMNSDCVFEPGLIREACQRLDESAVVKARVSFESGRGSERLVAECRYLFHHVFQGGRKLFGPGLAFNKDICQAVGGYFFDEKMGWGEDGDLSKRILASSLEVAFLEKSVRHGREGVAHDLVIAYRIGKGNGLKDSRMISIDRSILVKTGHLLTDHHRQLRLSYQRGGCLLLIYLLVWKIAFHCGYYLGLRNGRKNVSL